MKKVRVKKFMNSSFKGFSLYDNVRSIPDIRDGLKPSQRKAVYGTLQRGENAGELQIERLATFCASETCYHHGAGSLEATITGMANTYPGSNNMNLFEPSGQFGSRLTKDAASARYIFTKLTPNFRVLFPKDDDLILHHLYDDGDKIEPEYFIPILPMLLINGAQGTGTGHACYILSYNPADLKKTVIAFLSGKKLVPGTLVPWFNGYEGTVTRNPETGQVVIEGNMEIVNSTTIKVTEIPIGIYLDQYREHLKKLEDEGFISDFSEDGCDDNHIRFTLKVPRATTGIEIDKLKAKLKLISRDTENFTVWTTEGVLKRYASAEELIEDWVVWRLERYEERRLKLIEIAENEALWTDERIRFIEYWLANTNTLKGLGKKELIEILEGEGFVQVDRLLSMSIWTLTKDKVEELKRQLDELLARIETLTADTKTAMMERELKELKL
ncbi:MAG: DNA gyrase subunit A [Candidatus Nitrosotenuis sp.]